MLKEVQASKAVLFPVPDPHAFHTNLSRLKDPVYIVFDKVLYKIIITP